MGSRGSVATMPGFINAFDDLKFKMGLNRPSLFQKPRDQLGKEGNLFARCKNKTRKEPFHSEALKDPGQVASSPNSDNRPHRRLPGWPDCLEGGPKMT